MNLPPFVKQQKDGFTLQIYVQPRASRGRLVGEHNQMLKVAITAPPVDGAANEAVIALLSEVFSVPKRQVTLLSGHTGRKKIVAITGVEMSTLQRVLEEMK